MQLPLQHRATDALPELTARMPKKATGLSRSPPGQGANDVSPGQEFMRLNAREIRVVLKTNKVH